MAKKEKVFPVKLYALVAFLLVAALLAVIVTVTFQTKYTGYHPDEVARVDQKLIRQAIDFAVSKT